MTQSQTKFVCVEPRTGKELYNYFNGALPQAQADQFEEHLFLCFQCKERFHHLEWIYGALNERSTLVKTASPSPE